MGRSGGNYYRKYRMSLFGDAKKEIQFDPSQVKEINLGGIVYKIPLRNGNLEKQSAVFDAVDAWLGYTANSEDDKSSRDDTKRCSEVVISILSLMNPIDKDVILGHATEQNAVMIYKIWRGTE